MQAVGQRRGNALLRFLGVGGIPHAGRRRPPALLWAPAVAVAVAMALPLVYLVERSLDGGGEVLDLLWRTRTLEIALRSAALVIVVTVASALIAVPLAWLTVRTDPAPATLLVRRHRASVGDSQLRGRVSGSGGAGSARHASGVDGETHRLGAAAGHLRPLRGGAYHNLLEFPLHSAQCAGQPVGARPRVGRDVPLSRQWTMEDALASHPAADAPVHCGGIVAGRAVHIERLRRGVAPALRDLHLGHLPAIRDRFRPVPGRGVVARDDWGRALVGGARGAGPRPFPLLPGGDGRGAARVACAFGQMAVARLWVCGSGNRALFGRAAGAAGVLGPARHRGGASQCGCCGATL